MKWSGFVWLGRKVVWCKVVGDIYFNLLFLYVRTYVLCTLFYNIYVVINFLIFRSDISIEESALRWRCCGLFSSRAFFFFFFFGSIKCEGI